MGCDEVYLAVTQHGVRRRQSLSGMASFGIGMKNAFEARWIPRIAIERKGVITLV